MRKNSLLFLVMILVLLVAGCAVPVVPSQASGAAPAVEEIAKTQPEEEPAPSTAPEKSTAETPAKPTPEPLVPLDEIISGGPPPDGIPPIDNPIFISVAEADEWLADKEPVVVVELNGVIKAYPLQIMTWHEIVNDEFGDLPVTVTFCPLCNTALVFDRRVNDTVLDFGTSGKLYKSALVMYDRQTKSLWSQVMGQAIVGELTGTQLEFLPAAIVSWADFKASHPDGLVLSRETGYQRPYGANPYAQYDAPGQRPFLFFGKIDPRLQPMERVVGVEIGGEAKAYAFSDLSIVRVVADTVGGQDIVVFYYPGTTSALDQRSIAESRDVGAAAVFDSHLDGEKLTFTTDDQGRIVDEKTGSVWNILGEAISGPLQGKKLRPIVHGNHFWFAWAAFHPDTRIYGET